MGGCKRGRGEVGRTLNGEKREGGIYVLELRRSQIEDSAR